MKPILCHVTYSHFHWCFSYRDPTKSSLMQLLVATSRQQQGVKRARWSGDWGLTGGRGRCRYERKFRRKIRPVENKGLRTLYREPDYKVRAVHHNQAEGDAYFRRYVDFALSHVPCANARILDLGCGSGWSTVAFRNAGHCAFGVDLAVSVEAREADKGVAYVCADATTLPFRDSSMDLVGMHQVLEHMPHPESVLREVLRVLKPKGQLVVVGPNLLSVGQAIKFTVLECRNMIRNRGHWERTEGMPRHPFGNTLPENYQYLFHHAWRTVKKLLGEKPVNFVTRTPDTQPPFHGDNDASYFCNPMDLLLWAKQTKTAKAIRWWGDGGRLNRVLWPVWGGTWVILEKR